MESDGEKAPDVTLSPAHALTYTTGTYKQAYAPPTHITQDLGRYIAWHSFGAAVNTPGKLLG